MSTNATVQILDLGLNNLTSLSRSLRNAGMNFVRTVSSGSEFGDCRLVVLPGVGAFGAAMASLRSRDLEQPIRDHLQSGGFLMGICLGMHLLMERSAESPEATGLGLIGGEVVRIPVQEGARIPHIGWTSMESFGSDFPELRGGQDFYFVHSYVASPDDAHSIIARAHYGNDLLVAAVLQGQVVGFQFHPEKSSKPGARLLNDVRMWAGA